MIEIGFAFILGFAITSTLCGFIADHSRADRILIRAMVYIAALTFLLGLMEGEFTSFTLHATKLCAMSFAVHYMWLIIGAVLAIIAQMISEGHAYNLWVKLHPQSAPTPEARVGQRAQPIRSSGPVAATLVGTSTEFLKDGLDLRTDTLVRLCFYAFEDRGALTLSRLEANLRLGTGRRQKSFHKLAAGLRKRPKLKTTVHRYYRSVNGSSRMTRGLFGDLCRLARETRNQDAGTIGRLTQTGHALELPADEITRLINGSR